VPEVLFNESRLERLGVGTLFVDLASKPGTVSVEAAQRAGVNVIWALSLPGKIAPVTAGQIIADTIMNILSENGGE
jgi:dipicolinate synthase subunit A